MIRLMKMQPDKPRACGASLIMWLGLKQQNIRGLWTRHMTWLTEWQKKSRTEQKEAKIWEAVKHHGFKWSPKNNCWQRQLRDNARYSLKCLIKQLEELERLL
ncbi:hypothetical protein AALB16_09140 [Lachnospiraceae bacterium 62-35]